MFSVRVKVRKKDFCIVLAVIQQKCRDRAPLNSRSFEHVSIDKMVSIDSFFYEVSPANEAP